MSTRFDRLTLLETFVRIAERGSLSEAARDLGTSQPSISRQLAALETRLDTILARRTTHSVTLTADGRALLQEARGMLSAWDSIEEQHQQDGTLKGRIRVIAPVALGQSGLMAPVAAFMAAHPQVSIDWHLRDTPIRFAEEGCDCWIKVGPVPDETLVVRELAQVERLVVGSPAQGRAEDIEALHQMPWITLGPFEGNRIELFDTAGGSHSFTAVPRMSTENIFALLQAVRHGAGVAILPKWLVSEDLAAGDLIEIAPDWRAARLPINLALAAGTKRAARVTRFCADIEDWCRNHLDAPGR